MIPQITPNPGNTPNTPMPVYSTGWGGGVVVKTRVSYIDVLHGG